MAEVHEKMKLKQSNEALKTKISVVVEQAKRMKETAGLNPMARSGSIEEEDEVKTEFTCEIMKQQNL